MANQQVGGGVLVLALRELPQGPRRGEQLVLVRPSELPYRLTQQAPPLWRRNAKERELVAHVPAHAGRARIVSCCFKRTAYPIDGLRRPPGHRYFALGTSRCLM